MIPKAFLGIKLNRNKKKSDTETILELAYGSDYNKLTSSQRKGLIKQYEGDNIAKEQINQLAAQRLQQQADARANMEVAPIVDENRFTPDLTVPKEKILRKNASYAESPRIVAVERPVASTPSRPKETQEQVARRIIDANRNLIQKSATPQTKYNPRTKRYESSEVYAENTKKGGYNDQAQLKDELGDAIAATLVTAPTIMVGGVPAVAGYAGAYLGDKIEQGLTGSRHTVGDLLTAMGVNLDNFQDNYWKNSTTDISLGQIVGGAVAGNSMSKTPNIKNAALNIRSSLKNAIKGGRPAASNLEMQRRSLLRWEPTETWTEPVEVPRTRMDSKGPWFRNNGTVPEGEILMPSSQGAYTVTPTTNNPTTPYIFRAMRPITYQYPIYGAMAGTEYPYAVDW